MPRAAVPILLAVLIAALPSRLPAQVAIGLGAGVVYGPIIAPVVVVPYAGFYGYGYGYGAGGYVYPPPRTGDLPACYRVGRCTLADLYALGGRPDRLDRLAPTPPEQRPPGRAFDPPANVPPTAESEIQPGYRGASLPREEFRESGSLR